jgi:hypothetical protein
VNYLSAAILLEAIECDALYIGCHVHNTMAPPLLMSGHVVKGAGIIPSLAAATDRAEE